MKIRNPISDQKMTVDSTPSIDALISSVRQFNRFYTRQIGLLGEGLLHSPYNLTEARILFELAQRENVTASDLCRDLGIDAGYLSRLLTGLEHRNLIHRVRSDRDRRERLLSLTAHGKAEFAVLDVRSHEEIAGLLHTINPSGQQQLVGAMNTIERILQGNNEPQPFNLRMPEPGDMGWVVQQHGALYAREYGWTTEFEAMVAQIASEFITHYDPPCERGWIAEIDGENVGCVFLVKVDATTAKLRMLLVHPKARGLGLGTALVEACIEHARACGYKKLILWTNSILLEARHIYEKKGFALTTQESHHSFGHDLIGETWELAL